MSHLSCNVSSCAANQSGCCCLPAIRVEGKAAHTSDETICGSYQRRGAANNSATNGCCTPNSTLDVGCTACSCVYYKNDKCTSDRVSIESGTAESQCATFKC